MLVLSRRVGESIYIDGDIRVEIVKVNGNRVKIGIEAPDEVRILRSELSDQPEIPADCHFHTSSRSRSNKLVSML